MTRRDSEADPLSVRQPETNQPGIGLLVDRADLSDAVILESIRERLLFEGRTGPEPEVVVEAARLKKRKAIAFLRKLILPQPSAGLAMPVQPILRSQQAAKGPADTASH